MLARRMKFFALLMFCCFSVSSACPKSCSCTNSTLKCSELITFPNISELNFPFSRAYFDNCSFGSLSLVPYVNLSTLSIHHSRISNITGEAFKQLTSLTTLDLSCNLLSQLNEDTFSGLDMLHDLYLNDNQIVKLPDRFFDSLPSLVHLYLSGNKGFHFSNGSSSQFLDKLTYVDCSRCDMDNITVLVQSIEFLKNIEVLILDGNRFEHLPSKTFSKFPNLKSLSLERCSIKNMSESAFNGLKKLQKINLASNSLKNLPLNSFHCSMQSLYRVYLQDNNLTSAEVDFSSMSNLAELRLDGNNWICECGWMQNVHAIKQSKNVSCLNSANETVSFDQFSSHCGFQTEKPAPPHNHSIMIGVLLTLLLLILAIVACLIYRVIANRRRRTQEKKSVRYSAVYRETVESSAPTSRTTIDSRV